MSRRKPLLANRTPPEVEALIVALSLELCRPTAKCASPTNCRSAGLFGLFTDLVTGNSKESNVLEFSCGGCGPAGAAVVADSEKRLAVEKLLGR